MVTPVAGIQMEYLLPHDVRMHPIPRVLHVHDDKLELVYISNGEAEYQANGKHYPVKAGDLMIFQPGVIHGRESAKDLALQNFCCAIRNFTLDELPPNHLFAPGVCPLLHCGDRAPEFHALMFLLQQHAAYDTPQMQMSIQHLLNVLVQLVIEVANHPPRELEDEEAVLVRRIKHFADKHYMESLSLSDIANALNISLFYMSHLFKEKTGYTPLQYIATRQIGEAQTLLIHTDLSVQAIAERVGYLNPEHFNKVFKKQVGLPPGQFRKVSREDGCSPKTDDFAKMNK